MTRRMQLVLGDDLVDHESKSRKHVDADETLCVALGPGPDRMTIRELDLTKEHADELRLFLKRYLDAGHEPGAAPLPPAVPPAARSRPPGQPVREVPGTRRFYLSMREYADSHGIRYGTDSNGSKHNYRYGPELVTAFREHLILRARLEDQVAVAQLAIGRELARTVRGLAPFAAPGDAAGEQQPASPG